MTDHHECHMQHVKLLADVSAWKGLARELHGMLCDAVEYNWVEKTATRICPTRYDEIMERVNENWYD